jgi:xylulokinase
MDADPLWREETGNIVFPGFTAPKLAWVRGTSRRCLRPRRQGAAAEGLPAPLADRRAVAEMSDAPAPAGSTPARATGRTRLLAQDRADARADAAAGRGLRGLGHAAREPSHSAGACPGPPVAGGGGDNAASAVGVGVVRAGRASSRSAPRACCSPPMTEGYTPGAGNGGAHLLPRAARHLAPDGRDPRRDGRAELVRRLSAQSAAALTGALGPLQAPGQDAVPALSRRRAHAAQRRRHPRRLHRAGARHRPRGGDPRGAGGRGLRLRDCRDALAATGCGSTACWRSAAARSRTTGFRPSPPRSACRSTCPGGDFGGAFGAARLGMMARPAAAPRSRPAPRSPERRPSSPIWPSPTPSTRATPATRRRYRHQGA